LADRLRLSAVFSDYGVTRGLRNGSAPVDGVELEIVEVEPVIAAYRRMIRDLEFDVCELAPTTYLMAREAGIPITALPIFVMRKFHHSDLVGRADANIEKPVDLEGRRVGVRAYSVTSGVWVRSIVATDHGVDLDSITWVIDDEDHVSSYQNPANVERLPKGTSIAEEFARGGISAALTGPAGVGRSGSPTGGWKAADVSAADPVGVFHSPADEAADWHRRTGVYPIHGVLTVRDDVLRDNPWVAQALTDAFVRSRDEYVATLDDSINDSADDRRYRELRSVVGDQPLPYGTAANAVSLEALVGAAHDQGLIQQRPQIEDLFADVDAR